MLKLVIVLSALALACVIAKPTTEDKVTETSTLGKDETKQTELNQDNLNDDENGEGEDEEGNIESRFGHNSKIFNHKTILAKLIICYC